MHHRMGIALVALASVGAPALAEGSKPAPASGASATTEETVVVKKGSHHELRIPGMTRVAIDDPEIAGINATGKGVLRITGKQAVETALLVWAGPEHKRSGYRLVVID
ncbi:pilus assembly protein N-terminal domain-containing protein [Myxococcus sp. SDU36]|uniref:pilus assembly protein N-terminal domain-containing protein n=1 Tax=Myxococcus sp. SDU36 TaxID=2831967 RepID=UPI0025433AAB|nr:pilus assembly protein N-terminal domain-containing protein [Myxococcus sp. SDU36]